MIGRIYQLVCPVKEQPIYVGSTKRPLNERLKEHVYSRKTSNQPIYDYLFSNKITPIIELLQEIEIESAKELLLLERGWTEKLTKEGVKLFNHNRPQAEQKFSGSLRIDYGIHEQVKDVCIREGMSLVRFYEIAAIDRLKKFGVEIPN